MKALTRTFSGFSAHWRRWRCWWLLDPAALAEEYTYSVTLSPDGREL